MTVPVVLAIAGVAALFLGIWGGGIKAKEIEIPRAPIKARSTISIIGFVLIGISVWLSTTNTITLQSIVPSTNTPTATVTTVPSLTPTSITSTSTPSPVPTISSSALAAKDAQATVARSKVDTWAFGLTTLDTVAYCLGEFDKVISPYISFKQDDTIPSGVLLTANFWVDNGVYWNELPVKPICAYNSWGLFESIEEFQSVGSGKYRLIVP